jgi:hypothetical protein
MFDSLCYILIVVELAGPEQGPEGTIYESAHCDFICVYPEHAKHLRAFPSLLLAI